MSETLRTYEIRTINDMLAVPADRRGAMLKELGLALALHEFACGDIDPLPELEVMEWCDDGDITSKLMQPDGTPVCTLQVTEEAPE